MIIKNKRELSEKELTSLAESVSYEQGMLMEQSIIDNQFEKLLSQRIILINDIISESTIEKAVMPLIEMDNDGTGKEITIYINTNGGSVYDGLVLCNVIEKLKTPTKIIVLGYAYSMGSILLMSGSNNPNVKRYCYSFSTALIHGGSSYIGGTSSQVKDYFKFNEQFEKRITKFILEHTNMTEDDYSAIERCEAYMDSDEMLKIGLVDEII